VDENFTRVETFGSPDVHWLRASVNFKDPNVFNFQQRDCGRKPDRSSVVADGGFNFALGTCAHFFFLERGATQFSINSIRSSTSWYNSRNGYQLVCSSPNSRDHLLQQRRCTILRNEWGLKFVAAASASSLNKRGGILVTVIHCSSCSRPTHYSLAAERLPHACITVVQHPSYHLDWVALSGIQTHGFRECGLGHSP